MVKINKKHEYVVGNIYGILKLLEIYREPKENHRLYAKVQCIKCKKMTTMRATQLFNKKYISCVCQLNNFGLTNHKLYSVYYNMRDRCLNERCHAYKDYGGRGITICEEWLGLDGYRIFYDWATSNGYKEGLSIDRIDNDGNYTPTNCQWITLSENLAKANKINFRRKSNNGKYYGYDPSNNYFEFDNAAEFARQYNLNAANIRDVANGRKKTHKGWIFGFVINNSVNV